MRYIISIALLLAVIYNCSAPKTLSEKEQAVFAEKINDTVIVKNDRVEYEITIIEPGFNFWLNSIARRRGYYSKQFMEKRNHIYVTNWNQRVVQPQLYDPNLYIMQIDYDPNIDYGYEVNYKLYNYFIYFQRKYKQRLGPFVPRI